MNHNGYEVNPLSRNQIREYTNNLRNILGLREPYIPVRLQSFTNIKPPIFLVLT